VPIPFATSQLRALRSRRVLQLYNSLKMLRRCICQLQTVSGTIDLTRLHATTVTSPLGGLLGQLFARSNAGQVKYSSSTATPADPFTAKLQKNAEQQLLEMMEAARGKKLAEQGQGKLEEEDDEDEMVDVSLGGIPATLGHGKLL
jgi:hypothetical protein